MTKLFLVLLSGLLLATVSFAQEQNQHPMEVIKKRALQLKGYVDLVSEGE